jgi:hypothetical protein
VTLPLRAHWGSSAVLHKCCGCPPVISAPNGFLTRCDGTTASDRAWHTCSPVLWRQFPSTAGFWRCPALGNIEVQAFERWETGGLKLLVGWKQGWKEKGKHRMQMGLWVCVVFYSYGVFYPLPHYSLRLRRRHRPALHEVGQRNWVVSQHIPELARPVELRAHLLGPVLVVEGHVQVRASRSRRGRRRR